jgi:hypothetical protein
MPYEGPRSAIVAVLVKVGVDPRERIDDSDQDPEYTACRSDEIDKYFALYKDERIDKDERAVLCCFLLDGLNDLIQAECPHPRQHDPCCDFRLRSSFGRACLLDGRIRS